MNKKLPIHIQALIGLCTVVSISGCNNDDPRRYFVVKDILCQVPVINSGRIGIIKYYYDGATYNFEMPFAEDTILDLLVRSVDPYPKIGYPDDENGGSNEDNDTTSTKLESQPLTIDTRKNGLDKGYYANGKLKWEFNYKNGRKEGLQKEYYDNGAISWETPYKHDKRNGTQKEFYRNGQVEWEIPYNMDRINGEVKELYESGSVKENMNFKNDRKSGLEKVYYESGATMGEYPYSYSTGKLNGVAKQYYETGELYREIPYTNGKMNGTEKIYDKSGKIAKETVYINGKKHKSTLHY